MDKAGRHCRALWTAQRRQQRKQRYREASRAVVPELSTVLKRSVASEAADGPVASRATPKQKQ